MHARGFRRNDRVPKRGGFRPLLAHDDCGLVRAAHTGGDAVPEPGSRRCRARPAVPGLRDTTVPGRAACAPGRRGCVALTTGPATATVRTMRPICDGKSMLDGNKVDKNDPFVSVERGSSGKIRATYGIYMT